MRKTFLSGWRDEKGAVAVEFALILPMLVTMLIGIADFGTYMHESMQLDTAARQAVQYVVQGGNPTKIEADVLQTTEIYQQLQGTSQPINYAGTQSCICASGAAVNCSGGSCPAGDYVRSFYDVTITSSYLTIIPWTGISDSISIQGHAHMQYDR